MLRTIFSGISFCLTAYSFIIFIRIMFSWFNLRNNRNGAPQNKIITFLYSITDPYLNWFQRFSFLRLGMMDFSAMLAIVVLYFFSNISAQIAFSGVITISFIIKLIISTIWSLASSILFFFLIVIVVRLVFLHLNKYSPIFGAMDGYLESLGRRFSNIFTKRFTPYKTNLLILAAGIFIARLGLKYIIAFLFTLF